MGFEDEDSINSEIRYITIELMKIAAQRGITFEEAARDFLKNAIFLKRLIEITESTDQMSRVLLSKINMEDLQKEYAKEQERLKFEKEIKETKDRNISKKKR
ncbi:MAG: hypothetical protein QXK21_02190 [Candidatus Micrarchaeia archaeon]